MSDKTTEVAERGYFWLKEDDLAEDTLVPEHAVSGLLEITPTGRISVGLDGILSTNLNPCDNYIEGCERLRGKSVGGFLKGDGRHVLLLDVAQFAARMGTDIFAHQTLSAMYCLLGPVRLPAGFKIDRLDISLIGFEEWLNLGSIEAERNSDTHALRAVYEMPPDVKYEINLGLLEVTYDIVGPWGKLRTDELILKETGGLSIKLTSSHTIQEVKTLYDRIQELFILLTNSEHQLTWPTVVIQGKRFCLHAARHRGRSGPVTLAESWTDFKGLSNCFGDILGTWLALRECAGPGAYLCLGNRRGMDLFVEHQFVNLMWGLEALHRRTIASPENEKIASRVDRIIGKIHDVKDKAWLAKRLKTSAEPTLEQRVFELLSMAWSGIELDAIRAFANTCARLRNDISHYGGGREVGGDSQAFLIKVSRHADALLPLYQLVLLTMLKLPREMLAWVFNDNHKSYRMREAWRTVGMLPERLPVKKGLRPKKKEPCDPKGG